ncbi:MAG: ABC transporter permease, partial [Acidimicrobiia bacterium]|nr:ABC transporter permease [Acidimicrobiia bacterium]
DAPPPVSLGTIDAASRRLDGPTSIMAGMAIFFLFFTVQFGVTSLLEERREGTYARLQASPIPRWATVAAKGLGGFLLGIIAMTVLMVASSFLIGAEWGPIVPVALLVVAGVVSAVGIMGIVAAFAKTPESAGNIQSIIGVTLGLLGGSFFPIGQDGGLLSKLQFVTPHAWFLRGLGDLAGDGELVSVLPAVGALGLFGLVTGGVAWVLLRRADV